MRTLGLVGFVCAIALVSASHAAPVGGAWSGRAKGDAVWKTTKIFRGGERASVQVIDKPGDLVPLRVAVFDSTGVLMGEDKGDAIPEGTYMSVSWFPPRDGTYSIEIRHVDNGAFNCYVTIK